MGTKKLVILSLLLALGVVLYVAEALYLPSLPIPGAKLGLANVVTLLVLFLYGWREAIANAVLRTIVGSVAAGTLLTPAFFFSFVGALVSALVMIAVFTFFFGKLSLVGISLAGAVSHNLAQTVLASFLLSHWAIFLQTPLLILIAILAGSFNGLCANCVIARIVSFPKDVLEIETQDDRVIRWAEILSASSRT